MKLRTYRQKKFPGLQTIKIVGFHEPRMLKQGFQSFSYYALKFWPSLKFLWGFFFLQKANNLYILHYQILLAKAQKSFNFQGISIFACILESFAYDSMLVTIGHYVVLQVRSYSLSILRNTTLVYNFISTWPRQWRHCNIQQQRVLLMNFLLYWDPLYNVFFIKDYYKNCSIKLLEHAFQPRLQGALFLKQKGPLKGVHGNRGS